MNLDCAKYRKPQTETSHRELRRAQENVLHLWTTPHPPTLADEVLTEGCTYSNKGQLNLLIVKFELSDREMSRNIFGM